MSDIFREVDEEVRRDEALKIWEKYQNLVIALAIAIVVATAGYKFWQGNKIKSEQAAGAQYQAALTLAQQGKAEDAAKAFAAMTDSSQEGYKLLARLQVANETAQSDPAAAVKAYDAIAADTSVNPVLQEAARLRAALLVVDAGDMAEIARRLQPLTGDRQPFRNTAREAYGYAALKANDFDLASKLFDAVAQDPEASAAERERMDAMLSYVKANQPAKAP
ncbi:tetratricopeptide repeat protein [Methylovirgula sp. 4M-Z18]|uniref:tetratricopeptide repeat protein n=1 Tax=Methylovirgula sp. 4M-Z18 TaxID=2293567 RepID=UPI000E2FD834|nr:tetratricopeptide repeat protein [Methylovirgula sp. 4M-Z18]RFB80701.1 hypothetical protein DYH55_04175 [Methylovirgula sp. 4M-Z18]